MILLNLTPQQGILLLESLTRDADHLHQRGSADALLVEDILVKCRSTIVEKIGQGQVSKEQVEKYVQSQMKKISFLKNEQDAKAQPMAGHDLFDNS